MTTSKVTFYHKENPYIVMPIEIPNESWIKFTRASNKVALYGPTWIFLTGIPLFMGMENIALTIYFFKLLPLIGYACMLLIIFLITKDIKNVIFFGLNPLVLIEVLVSAHNDIIMMVFAILGLVFLSEKKIGMKLIGYVSLILSIFVKGATLILLPLYIFRRHVNTSPYVVGYWLMLAVFFLTPIREELYPWYAIWFLVFAACVPFRKDSFIHYISIALSIGLTLRHLPYILTREYGGSGPLIRTIVTIVPPAIYLVYWGLRFWQKKYKTVNG